MFKAIFQALNTECALRRKEMDSVIIETLGCPLDPALLKSWELFSLESSHSFTSSDPSESADEETENNHDDLLQQLNNLSIDDVSDSKYASPKYSHEITEINAQEKGNSEDLILLEDEENHCSSFPFKNKELLKFAVETGVKFVFPKLSNKNCEIYSREKNNAEKLIFEDSTEINENQFSSSPFENNKLLNTDYKSSSDASAEDESDSDDDEIEESVTLRERYPNRHNRPENNKQQRTVPFPRTHSRTYEEHLYSNNSQIGANYHSTSYNFNASHDGYEYLNQFNSARSERYNRTFPPYFTNSESVTDEEFGSIVLSTSADQIVNGVIPCNITDQIVNGINPCDISDQIVNDVISYVTSDQIVNGVIPCAVTDQIVNGVIPYTVADEVFDSVVPSADDVGNVNDTFFAEINDGSYFDNLIEKVFPESIDRDYAVTNEGRFLDSYFDDALYIQKNLTKSKSDSFPSRNHVDLIEDNSVATTSKEISYPKSNLYYFGTESDGSHSFFSNIDVEVNSFNSNLSEVNGFMGKSAESHGYECLANKSGNYSNMVSKNFTSINSECLSPETSDYNNVSEEIERKITELSPPVTEMGLKGQKSAPELSPPVTKTSWDMLPFVQLDSNSISECTNSSECALPDKKKGSKSKRINHTHKSASKADETKIKLPDKKKGSKSKHINNTCKSAGKAEEPKICRIWGTAARDQLFHSASFNITKWELENAKMRHQIKNGEFGNEQKKIIHFLKKNRKTKYKGTNLHYAILSGNTERVLCIIELHKEYHGTTNEINLRDSPYKKTVLDYSKEKDMDLLTAYLEENDAKENVVRA